MLWAKRLWRRSFPVNTIQLSATRPSFRPGLELLESREQPGSLLAVAAAVASLPPASTFSSDYSVAPAVVPTTPSADPTAAPTPAVTTPNASGDATAFYVAVTSAYTSITNAAATPYDDPALVGDPTFSSSTDPAANQSPA
jgi:hypothetical protein